MGDLLSRMKKDVSVVQIGASDRDRRSDALVAFRGLVLESEPEYPGIGGWLEERVLADLGTASGRVALLAYQGDVPVASAVLKANESAKICHLKIAKRYEGTRLGDLLFCLMVAQAAPIARSVHFTLPEAVWLEQGGFFHSFGFERAERSMRQYRGSEDELVCTAPFSSVWQATLGKLPKLVDTFSLAGSDVKPSIMLSIHPRFAELILQGKKRVEVRTRFSEQWAGHRMSIYATSPIRSVVGEADIDRVESGPPQQIWQRYGDEVGCTRSEFESYAGGRSRIFALELGKVLPYETRVPFDELTCEKASPPQAYCRLLEGSPLTRAAMMASLVHATSALR